MSGIQFYGRWLDHRSKVTKEFVFIAVIAARICQKSRTPPRRSFKLARDAYFAWKDASGCKFGDPDFAWSVGGAIEIADGEIGEWERP